MIHTLYKTTNTKNGKFYIGVHSTDDVYFGTSKSKDRYLGSGPRLKSAIKHYGRENFIIEVIAHFDNEDLAYAAEGDVVTEEFIQLLCNYNLTVGGSKPPRGNPPPPPQFGNKHAVGHAPWNKDKTDVGIVGNKKAHLNGLVTRFVCGQKAHNDGIKWGKDVTKKISESLLKRQQRWITDGINNRLTNDALSDGWRLGRTMTWKRNQRSRVC